MDNLDPDQLRSEGGYHIRDEHDAFRHAGTHKVEGSRERNNVQDIVGNP